MHLRLCFVYLPFLTIFNSCDNNLHVYYSFIVFFSSNFRELIDELQAKVQWLYNKFHGHCYHHFFSFFLQSFLLITQKMFLFLLCFVLFRRCFLFVLIKSKGTMASAATKITILINFLFSSLESFLSSHPP